MMQVWNYDPKSKRYRNTATGKYIGTRQMLALRDQFTEHVKMQARALTDSLSGGGESLGPWMSKMRDLIKRTYIDQYVPAAVAMR